MEAGVIPSGLGLVPVPPVSRFSGLALGELLATQRQAARDADWPLMMRVSLTLLGAGEGHGVAVRAVRAADAAQADLALDVSGQIREGLALLAARPDHPEQAQGIREVLEAAQPGLAERAGPLLDQVAAGVIGEQPFLETQDAATLLGQAPVTDSEAALCVAATTRGLLGLVHAVVNTTQTAPDPGAFRERLEDLNTARVEVGDGLRRAELALFSACVGGDRDAVAAAARGLAETVPDLLVPFAAQQARARLLVDALLSAGRNGDAEQVGRVLAVDGWLVRRAVADAAVATRLRLDLPLRTLPETVAALIDAQAVAFDVTVPDGRNTPIAHLGADDDGILVQVEGFVVEASAAREPDGKLVGRLTLHDPSSGATVEVAAVFLHPAHVGITVGSYVIVHGTYRVATARLDGRAGVESDTLAPAQLAAQSWQARLWFAAARWVDVWRGNLHLDWSLGTHTAGTDDSDDPTRGAAELIYAPFARTED